MTTENNKYEVNENWYKCSDNNKVEIQAYNRYLDEKHNPVKLGGFNIEMGFTIFETWADFHINVYDRDDKLKDQIVIKTTLDQVIKVKPTNLAFFISDKDKKKYKHSVEMGRFHFYDFKPNTTILKNKLWDEKEISNVKKQRRRGDFDNNRIEDEMERFRVEVGHRDRVKPGNLVGAIANEAGLKGRMIGRIRIFENYSLVDLPKQMPDKVFQALKRVKVMNRELQINRTD